MLFYERQCKKQERHLEQNVPQVLGLSTSKHALSFSVYCFLVHLIQRLDNKRGFYFVWQIVSLGNLWQKFLRFVTVSTAPPPSPKDVLWADKSTMTEEDFPFV